MARVCTFAVPGVFALVLAVHHAVLALAPLVRVRPHDTPQALVQIPQVRRTCTIAPWGSVILSPMILTYNKGYYATDSPLLIQTTEQKT